MTSSDPTAPSPADGGKKRRASLYVVLGIIGAVLIAIVFLLISLLNKSDDTTTPEQTLSTTTSTAATSSVPMTIQSPTPAVTGTSSSSTSEPDPTDATSPPTTTATATGPEFASFDAPTTEGGCSLGGPSFVPTPPLVKVTWTAAGAEEAWFVQGTSDAADSQYMQLPLSGNQDDFPFDEEFSCNSDSSTYTITLVGSDGTHVSKSWTVENTGEVT